MIFRIYSGNPYILEIPTINTDVKKKYIKKNICMRNSYDIATTYFVISMPLPMCSASVGQSVWPGDSMELPSDDA